MTNGRGGCAFPFDSSSSQFYGRNNALSSQTAEVHLDVGGLVARDTMICAPAPVSARAPSVTVVSRHQAGATEWLAQNPFLIPRISKVSASTEEDNFRRCSQRSQLDTHSRHTKNQQ